MEPQREYIGNETASGIDSTTSGSNQTYWLDSVKPQSVRKNIPPGKTDVVIVGGGIAGLSVAYNLVQAGLKIVLVEDGNLLSGETGRTTAHLVTALDDRYYDIQRIFGKEHAALVAASHSAAIDFIERTIDEEGIECDFKRVDGYLFLHPSDKPESLEKELQACFDAGLDVVPLEQAPGTLKNTGPCICFHKQARFHPVKYLNGLIRAIVENGGIILTDTHASEINNTGIVTQTGTEIKADHIVIATNAPVNSTVAMPVKQYPYRTYVIAAKIKKQSLPDALWWDTGDFNANADIPPYHYVRLQPFDDTYDLIIAGGEDHATGMAAVTNTPEFQRYEVLKQWLRQWFPAEDIVYKWSGQVMEPMDAIAYIGRSPGEKNIYVVTGDSGNGMTHATIAGKLITDLIQNIENPLAQIYDPSRLKLFKAGKVLLKEFSEGFFSYLKHKSDDKINDLYELREGEGKIIELDKTPCGVYRDNTDTLHFVQATCTHMGCIIKWNSDEKTWDCPCHGSRFSYEGKVINGPANSDLFYFKEIENNL